MKTAAGSLIAICAMLCVSASAAASRPTPTECRAMADELAQADRAFSATQSVLATWEPTIPLLDKPDADAALVADTFRLRDEAMKAMLALTVRVREQRLKAMQCAKP